jgi:hypothetical protein
MNENIPPGLYQTVSKGVVQGAFGEMIDRKRILK